MGGGATGLVLSAVARLVCVPVAGTESESGFRIGAAGVRGSACTPWSGTLTSLLARLGTAEGAPTPATPMGSAAFFEGGGALGMSALRSAGAALAIAATALPLTCSLHWTLELLLYVRLTVPSRLWSLVGLKFTRRTTLQPG